MDLWDQPFRVAGGSRRADQIAGCDGTARAVGGEVRVVEVAGARTQDDGPPAQRVRLADDDAVGHSHYRGPSRREQVVPLVDATAGPRSPEGIGQRQGPLNGTDPYHRSV